MLLKHQKIYADNNPRLEAEERGRDGVDEQSVKDCRLLYYVILLEL